ncbi:MAG: RNA polymerase sigma factor [Bacteroidota bacterium]
MTEKELIAACRRQDRKAQKLLFDRFSPTMLGVCRRYVKNLEEAEDIMVEGFFKVLTKIDMYSGEGSFEGWIRRIMINESLMHLRKVNHFRFTEEIDANIDLPENPTIVEEIAAQEIIDLLDELPNGYRTVFNLYVVEGYKHREIAEELGISINTSKSQLILAKKRMEKLVTERIGIRR